MKFFLKCQTASSYHTWLSYDSFRVLILYRVKRRSCSAAVKSATISVERCKEYRCNVRVSKRTRGRESVLLSYYHSCISIIMQVQPAMFWWPLTLLAYPITLVTAAEEWKSEKCSWRPLPSQQHHSHLGNISLSRTIIDATFQIFQISQSWTLFMQAHWCGPFRDTL